MSSYPWKLFRSYRIAFGLYLFVNYLFFFQERIIFHPEMNLQYALLPGFLPVAYIPSVSSPEIAINLLLSGGIISAICLISGYTHRAAALASFICWGQLLAIHPLVHLPQDGYIGWFLLAFLFIPKNSESWHMPEDIWTLAWIVTGVSYSVSGYSKLLTPNWSEGMALSLIYGGGPVRLGLMADSLTSFPQEILAILTWSAVIFELLALPLCFFNRGRMAYWYGLLLFHFGILLTVDISSVTFAFLVLQLFLLRSDWLPEKLRRWLFGT